MWKTCVVAVMFGASSLAAHAQDRPAQQAVQWQLQVLSDGQQVDTFDATTTVGQAHTDTHHRVVTHDVGCKDQPGGSIDLSRTITVAPTQASAADVTLAIDTQETLEDPTAQQTDTGCKLPPQPRRVPQRRILPSFLPVRRPPSGPLPRSDRQFRRRPLPRRPNSCRWS